MDFTAVITARKNSQRLPGKNTSALGGRTLVDWSARRAVSCGMPVVISTDIPIGDLQLSVPASVISRPEHLRAEDCSHKETIEHALAAASAEESHCVLLQPTSPFRGDNILERCLQAARDNPGSTILTTQHVHAFVVSGGTGVDYGPAVVWDGCVAIFPPGKVCDYANVVPVKNYWLNSLQIDDADAYGDACSILAHTAQIAPPVVSVDILACVNALKNAGISGAVTLVARPDGQAIPQDHPVVWVNHCAGWDGQRADVLFLIANENLKRSGINRELVEVAAKAKLVIVRNNGAAEWLYENLPAICGKHVEIRGVTSDLINRLRTGALASYVLCAAGCDVLRVGFDGPCDRARLTSSDFHYPAVSLELAILRTSGRDRKR